MIDGEPRVVERDGHRTVGDGSGHELVIRCSSSVSGDRRYHRIDVEPFEQAGTLKPACEHKTFAEDAQWILRCRRDIDSIWTGCVFKDCYGEYVKGSVTQEPSLATTLDQMSVEEFDAQISTGDPR